MNEHTPIDIDATSLGNPGALPEEKPAAFPKQDFWQFDTSKRLKRTRDAAAIWRRTLIFGCPAIFAAFTAATLSDALQTGQIPALKTIMVSLFAVNIYWLAVLCTIAVAGFLVLLSRSRLSLIRLDDAANPSVRGKTAILMPVFAEAPERVFATALATLRSLARETCADSFDVFVLSDTSDPAIWVREEVLFEVARAQISGRQRLYYRRRAINSEKKAGNVADWCRRWGGAYDYMVVFDADSLMSGKTLVRLAAALEQNADVALIQTSSVLINRRTLFGRYQQFINRVYDYWCPAMTAGMAFWHRGSGSYWGHNAIIRVRAFCESAGLPRLSGEPPFGGHVLSHDFVEAALLRRAGWRLCLMPEIEESYEETPPTTIDWAIRERRWCQGNLQHGRILAARGLSWVSRVHLAFGIMYMVSSIIWICFIAAAFAFVIDVQRALPATPTLTFELFPAWLVRDPARAAAVVLLSLSLVTIPKLLGYGWVISSRDRRRAFGGVTGLSVSMLLSVLLAIVLAHSRILLRARACLEVLLGRDSGWKPPRRNDPPAMAGAFMRFHAGHMLAGAAVAAVAYAICPPLFLWLLPASLSLLASGPVSAICAMPDLGLRARSAGLLLIPEELSPPAVVGDLERHETALVQQVVTIARLGASAQSAQNSATPPN